MKVALFEIGVIQFGIYNTYTILYTFVYIYIHKHTQDQSHGFDLCDLNSEPKINATKHVCSKSL